MFQELKENLKDLFDNHDLPTVTRNIIYQTYCAIPDKEPSEIQKQEKLFNDFFDFLEEEEALKEFAKILKPDLISMAIDKI